MQHDVAVHLTGLHHMTHSMATEAVTDLPLHALNLQQHTLPEVGSALL